MTHFILQQGDVSVLVLQVQVQQGRMKHRGKSRAESQLKHFTKKLKIPFLSLADNPLHWKNSTWLSVDKDVLQGGEKSFVVR